MKKLLFILLFLSIQFINPAKNFAIGKLYCRIPWLDTSPIKNLDISSFSVSVRIIEQMAVTEIEQEYSNNSEYDFEGVFVYELPIGAKITQLAIWKNGEYIAYPLKSLEEAAEVYEEIVTRENDELFPENEPENIFRLRVFPVKALEKFKIKFSYLHLVPYDNGDITYILPMDIADYTTTPIQNMNIEINITSQLLFDGIPSTSYEESPYCKVEQLTPRNFKISYVKIGFMPDKDFVVKYRLKRNHTYFNVLTYTPSMDSVNYFTLWITPPDSLYEDTVLVKEIVFAVDLSSSMMLGERLRNLKQSLIYFINNLNMVDWFNIVTFNEKVSSFRSDLVRASNEMKTAAVDHVSRLSAGGLADTEGALAQSLAHQFSHRNRRIIILFTDGEPTAGITNSSVILNNVATNNIHDASIFIVGIGDEVPRTLFTMIANQNKGYAFFINSDDKLTVRLNELYPRIMVPALTDISIDYGSLCTLDRYPQNISNMIQGMQQVIHGRYQGEAEKILQLNGNVGSTPVTLINQIAFLQNSNEYVGKLWAAANIDYQLSLIKQYGEVQELIDAVVSLSKTYSILIPYTAFLLIQPGQGIPPSEVKSDEMQQMPFRYELSQNYPNPFNPTTRIKYVVAGENDVLQHVILKVYNTLGEEIMTLVDAKQAPGKYTVQWDASAENGNTVSSGLYFYHIQIANFKAIKPMIFIK